MPIYNIVFGNFVGPVMEPLRMAEKSMGFSCGGMLYEKKQWEREREREGKKREQPTNYLSHPGQVPGSCQPANGLGMRPKIKAFRPQRTLASLACLPALSPSAMQALVPLTRGVGVGDVDVEP